MPPTTSPTPIEPLSSLRTSGPPGGLTIVTTSVTPSAGSSVAVMNSAGPRLHVVGERLADPLAHLLREQRLDLFGQPAEQDAEELLLRQFLAEDLHVARDVAAERGRQTGLVEPSSPR